MDSKTKGIHFSAAESNRRVHQGGRHREWSPLPRRVSRHGETLAPRRMTQRSMYRLLMSYLERLPGAMHEKELPNGEKIQECVCSPHSIRATTATLLLDSSVAIESVQDLLDHKHITTIQIYEQAAALGARFRLPQSSYMKGRRRAKACDGL